MDNGGLALRNGEVIFANLGVGLGGFRHDDSND
jgi:hypothetical protein